MPFFGGSGGGDYHIDVTNIKGGTNAGQSVTGSNNMLLGNGSGQSLLLSDDNVFVGNNAGNMLGSLSSSNIIIGVNALSFYNAQVTDSVLIGHLAGYESFNNNITRSVIVGERASPLSGSTDDVIIGMGAEAAGSGNVVIGQGNGSNQPRANGSDVSIGAGSIAFDGQGVVLGYGAQGSLKNVAIGYQAKADLARAMTLPAIAIGANVSALAGQIVIGDSSYTSVVIGGVTLSSATGSIFPSIIVGDAGTEETGINIGGVNYDALLKVSDISSADIAQSIIHRHSTVWEPIQVFARSNSNGAGHGAVTNGMLISSQYAAGWTDTEYNLFGRVSFQASATGTISDASSPGDFVIATTPDGGTLPVEAVRVKSDKSTVFAGGVVYPASTFAALPAASVALNQIFRVTDIGPDGSLWESNGSEWKPVNGKALLKIGNYPVGMPNNGSIGANGAVTFTGTGLVDTYSGGIWLYYPAGALYAGSLAGFYWTVMTSATVGTVYNGMHDGATEFLPALAGTLTPIVSTAIGAFLAVGVNTQVSMFSIPANALGEFGTIEGIYSARFTSSASSKSITAFMGAGFVTINATTATTTNSFNGFIKTRNRGAGKQINNFNGLVQTPNTGGITQTAVDTTVSTPIVFALNNTGSNNDCLILESVELYISK